MAKHNEQQENTPASAPAATRDWSLLDGWEWAKLLSAQPQFSVHCNWNKLDNTDVVKLLSEQPQFAEHCNWSKLKLSGEDWAYLLSDHPEIQKFMDKSGALDFLELIDGVKYLENSFLSHHPPSGKKKKS